MSAIPKKLIFLILTLVLIRGVIYAVITPPWQAPDEPFHYEYIQELAKKYRPFSGNRTGLSAETEILISMQKWDFWRYQNEPTPSETPWGFGAVPFFTTIRYLGRSPVYYYLFLPFYRLVAHQSIEARLYLIRLINIIFAAAVILIAYLMAREIFPEERLIILSAPLFIAFLPMYTYISASVNSDNLSNLLFSLFLYLLVKSLKSGLSLIRAGLICLVFVLSLLTKRNTIAQIPIAFLFPFFLLFRNKSANYSILLKRLGAVTLALLSLALLYFNLAGSSIKISEIDISFSDVNFRFRNFFKAPDALSRIFFNLRTLFRSFWAYFGWMNIPLGELYYNILIVLSLISLIGLLVFFGKLILGREVLSRWQKQTLVFLGISGLLVVLVAFVRSTIFEFVPLQGRYVFPGITVFSLFFVLGVRGLAHPGYEKYYGLFLIGSLFLLDFISIFGYLIPKFYSI